MRISVRSSDPGHANFLGIGIHRVYLNGSEVHDVITADEDEGFVLRFARDEWGKPVLRDIGDGIAELVEETVRGKVEISTVQLKVNARPLEDASAS